MCWEFRYGVCALLMHRFALVNTSLGQGAPGLRLPVRRPALHFVLCWQHQRPRRLTALAKSEKSTAEWRLRRGQRHRKLAFLVLLPCGCGWSGVTSDRDATALDPSTLAGTLCRGSVQPFPGFQGQGGHLHASRKAPGLGLTAVRGTYIEPTQ